MRACVCSLRITGEGRRVHKFVNDPVAPIPHKKPKIGISLCLRPLPRRYWRLKNGIRRRTVLAILANLETGSGSLRS